MSEIAISSDGLVKSYRKVRAVDGLTLRVPRGSVYGFLGRNGAGKTTTIRMLMGLVRPTTGTTSVLDMSWPQDRLAILQRTAYVAEKKLLFEFMTGRDLVRFNRAFFHTWSDPLADKYVRHLEIPMDQIFKKLSLGNRTKLCLLIALAQGSELLILDEPTSGLDPVITDRFLRFLIEDFAGVGRTVFFCSHQLSEIEKVADWVGIIDGGKLLLEARLDDIRMQYRRIIVSGNDLPAFRNSQVVSEITSGSFREYVVSDDADAFIADFRNQGARIVEVGPLNLEELFLRLVGKEGTCTSGGVGATLPSTSSSR
jgi:ABC-2 type transport system ATP-binding protein